MGLCLLFLYNYTVHDKGVITCLTNIFVVVNAACWVKISADNILKYISYFSQKIDIDIPCKLHGMFYITGKNKKKNINLSSAEFALRVIKFQVDRIIGKKYLNETGFSVISRCISVLFHISLLWVLLGIALELTNTASLLRDLMTHANISDRLDHPRCLII